MFKKYQHIERLGTVEVEGLIDMVEPCYVFPKIDGTNASIWSEDGKIGFGSRNRTLSVASDNAGFKTEMRDNQAIKNWFCDHPDLRLYGEWLVPHTIKTYADDAWRKFYVFDVYDDESEIYLHFEEYSELLKGYEIDFIHPLAIIERATETQFMDCMEKNFYLMQDGNTGEGVVIKRYGFVNRFGHTKWAKIVSNDFKTKHCKEMGPLYLQATAMVEDSITNEFLTESMIDKVYANIVSEEDGWQSKFIPRLLQTVFYDLVKEETWNFVKKFKYPEIDFRALQRFTTAKIKQLKPELF